jgi:adenylate cyclase
VTSDETVDEPPEKLTGWQRRALRQVTKHARKHPGEPLTSEDWEAYMRVSAQPTTRFGKRVMRTLPSTPRCGYCGAPFAGIGARVVGRFGYRPSRKNPNICATCVELAPPGGLTAELGVVFADLRGFTSTSEDVSPAEATAALRRFYAHAERTFLPEALIDKLIGDEVMALYLPLLTGLLSKAGEEAPPAAVARLMVEHARELLERIGYGTADGPEVEVGIGIDFGEAFVGNVGHDAVHDFTAIGDVVNTASRLQGEAAGGEVIVSARVAALLDEPVGDTEQVTLKGKRAPVEVQRARWFA